MSDFSICARKYPALCQLYSVTSICMRHTELSFHVVEAANLLRKGALEGGRLRVELHLSRQPQFPSLPMRSSQASCRAPPRRPTSLKSIDPSSPSAETTSRPISLAMYSCVKDMSAERNMVSFGGAMVAAQETGLPLKMVCLKRECGSGWVVEG
jgi:hypothetical protein